MQQSPVDRRQLRWAMYVICGLSLSIGWGIRGQFGHEHGAMIPGALTAMAAVLVSGRADWQRRVAYFGLFGALGWAIGGCMSYGFELGYTHSGDPLNVVYGYLTLYVIGFLWGAVGGAGTALPAFLDRDRLTELLIPIAIFFGVLVIHDLTYDSLNNWLKTALAGSYIASRPRYDPSEPMNWFDSDWSTAVIGFLVALFYSAFRRRIDRGSALMLHLSLGWLYGFVLLPVALNVHMNPPRGCNWAGCLGLTVGLWIYLKQNNLPGVLLASVVTGIVGGIGFSCATMFQMVELKSGIDTNWHSVLEQTYGLINGLGIAAAMMMLLRRAPAVSDNPPLRRWTDWAAPAAILVLVTWLNARKIVEDWVNSHAFSASMYSLSTGTWFNIGYAAIGIAVVWLMVRHIHRPLALLPTTWLGKGQVLFLVFLWWVVAANFGKAVVGFAPQRLVTEGVILINAVIVTMAVATLRDNNRTAPKTGAEDYRGVLRPWLVIGVPACILAVMVNWIITHALFGVAGSTFRGKPRYRFEPIAVHRLVPRPRAVKPSVKPAPAPTRANAR